MKITEKFKDHTNEIQLEFKVCRGKNIITLSPTNDEPISVKLVPGGWNHGYPTYHVITEYGDMEQSEYAFRSLEEICERYNVTEESIKNALIEN